MVRIIWTNQAVEDLESIADFIASDSEKYAILTIQRIYQKIKIIKKFPKVGKINQELNDETIREILVGNYKVIYKLVNNKVISVLTIHHTARNFPELRF